MKEEKVERIIRNEMACVKMANKCSRNCAECPLVMEDYEIIDAYDTCISAVRLMSRIKAVKKAVIAFACAMLFFAGLVLASMAEFNSMIYLAFSLMSFAGSAVVGGLYGR